MTASRFPQPGDIIVATRAQQQGGADLHGVVLVARRDEPLQSEATDLSNVIPFARPRRYAAAAAFPVQSIAPDQRPAPHLAKLGLIRSVALFAGSLALHSALLAMFWQQPKPMASIGVEAMTVEITLGATTAAGLASTPGEREAQPVAPSEARAQDEPVTEQSRVTTVMPQEVPVATQETAPEVKPQETPPEAQAVDPKPQEQQPETAVAEIPAAEQPTEKPPERNEQPPQIQAVQKAPERKRTEAPTGKKAAQKKQVAAAPPTDAASGVGRGRSDRSVTYEGAVAAHIARHNRFPPAVRRATDARGVSSEFAVTLEYEIDGEGRVTSIKVLSSSGDAAIDRAVIAVVRQASPVPRPADGQPRKFSQRLVYNQKLIYRSR